MDAAETPSLRHRLLQGAGVLVALPLLYVLGAGPVSYLIVKDQRNVEFVGDLYAPLFRAANRTPLAAPFFSYVNWWRNLAENGHVF